MAEKVTVYATGARMFPKKDNQPAFVVGKVIITPSDLLDWCKANPQYTSEYQGKTQVSFDVKTGADGKAYMSVDTYKKAATVEPPAADDNSPF